MTNFSKFLICQGTEGKLWDVFCEFQLLSAFYHYNCFYICSNMFCVAVLYQPPTVLYIRYIGLLQAQVNSIQQLHE